MTDSVDLPFVDSLTFDQKEAFKSFRIWLEGENCTNPYVLSGFAGSGKTFLSMRLLKLAEKKNISWTVAAPTHKAVGVLRQAMDSEKLKPVWYPATIHRLLRLKLKRKRNLEICEKTEQTDNSLDQLGLVLIDESSMIDTTLLEIISQSSSLSGTRVVYVGDPAQLPPIGETISPVFSIKDAIIFQLDQVVRHQGPVLNLSKNIRNGIIPCKQPKYFSSIDTKKGVVGCLDKDRWLEKAQSALRLASEKDEPDKARILCYTNRFLDRLVPHVRRAIHGEMADHFTVLPGEVLMSQKAIMQSASTDEDESAEEPGVLLGSNREMVVLDVKSIKFSLLDLGLTKNYCIEGSSSIIETSVAKVRCNSLEFSLRLMPQVGTNSRNDLDGVLKRLSQKAKDLNNKEGGLIWKLFFYIRDSFAAVSPASVLTVHRSQGSTFENVYIASDVFWPKDIKLRRQLLYVAVSRASKGVWLLGTSNGLQEDWVKNIS